MDEKTLLEFILPYMVYEHFYQRAYADGWDDCMSEEDIAKANECFAHMSDTEKELYDEFLRYDNNAVVIEEGIRFAIGEKYNNEFEYGYPFVYPKGEDIANYESNKEKSDLIRLGEARMINYFHEEMKTDFDEYWKE